MSSLQCKQLSCESVIVFVECVQLQHSLSSAGLLLLCMSSWAVGVMYARVWLTASVAAHAPSVIGWCLFVMHSKKLASMHVLCKVFMLGPGDAWMCRCSSAAASTSCSDSMAARDPMA